MWQSIVRSMQGKPSSREDEEHKECEYLELLRKMLERNMGR